MTRLLKSKILYAIVLAGLFGIAFFTARQFNFQPNALVIVALCFLLPARITSYCWREFYAGQRLMQQENFGKANGKYETFLSQIRSRPWMKNLIIFKWGFFTWNIEAMTLNNLGLSYLEMNDLESARRYFDRAVALDPLYSVPYSNLAILSYVKGDDAQGRQLLSQSRSLGYSQFDEARAKKEAISTRSRLDSIV